MAQLNSLIVTGPSRFLNKLMATEIQATQLSVADKLSVTSSAFTYNSRKVMTGSSVGNSTTPVYIDANGYPVAISSYGGTSAVANKLGTATVGSGTKFIYLNGGTATASSSAVGASNKGVYLNSGTVTAMTYALNATINAGAANKLAYYSGANAISQYTSTVGTATKGVYMNAGWPTAMTYELKATLNNATQWGIAYYSTATNVTSTAAGTAGYLLQGNGAAAPSWIQATSANAANTIVKRDGSGNFSASTITASLNGNASSATKATQDSLGQNISDTYIKLIEYVPHATQPKLKYTKGSSGAIELNMPIASATIAGLITTGTQTIAGDKTLVAKLLIETTGTSSTNKSSTFRISSSESGAGTDIGMEFWRGTNASWQIVNSGGNLYFKTNYTGSTTGSYSLEALKLNHTTGAARVPYLGINGENTGYKLYVNGTSYFNGIAYHNAEVKMMSEKPFTGYQPRKKADGNEWAYHAFRIFDASNTDFAHFGVCGNGNTLNYIYIGSNNYNSVDNLMINSSGKIGLGIAPDNNYRLKVTGNTYLNGISYFANGTTYYINNSADAKLRYLALGGLDPTSSYQLYVNGTSWIKGNLSTRHLYPEADSTYDIGSTTYHWRYGYFDGLYISSNTSYSAWNSAANGVFINTDNFGIQRTSAGGGFYVYSNGIQVARMYLDTLGTAGDGINAGALGSARLVLGNSTARSSTSGAGANNARGSLLIYSQSNRPGVDIWGDNEGGNIQIYSPSQTYYTNASNTTAAHFWQMDSSNGNLRFYNYYGGSSTAASVYRGIYIERTGTIYPNDNNVQNLGTSSRYWANAYITTINGTTFTGNAASATKLATARTLTIGNTGKSFNGTADVSWSRDEIGCSYDHYTTWDFTKAYSSNYVTFDMQKPSGGPGGWINAFVSTHGNYLSSFIANVHRSGDWYVGWSEHSSTANVNPTWYKLLHTGNYTSTLDSRYILKSGDTMTGTINSMDIIPKADNTYTLGTSTNRWKEIFGYTLTAYTKLQAGSSYLNSSNDLYIARSVGIKVAPDTNYALKVTDNSYFNGHLILADNKFIRRNGRSVSWIQGRDGAILRQTTYTGYNPIISAKTTDGDWSFGPSGSNIMYLTYCTDANYNAGTNTTTAQFLFKPDGTMYIGSNKVLDSSMFSLSGTTLTITI